MKIYTKFYPFVNLIVCFFIRLFLILWTFKLKQIYSEVITGIQKIKKNNKISRELNV